MFDALGYRSRAAAQGAPGHLVWRFGREYYLQFWDERDRDRKVVYESTISIPAEVPRGRTYRVPVVAEKVYPALLNPPAKQSLIEGAIDAALPKARNGLWAEYGIKGSEESRRRVRADGSFAVVAKQLGGQLRVTARSKLAGTGWMYVRSVRKRRLQLPADADLVVKLERMVSFRVSVPREKIADDLVGLAIKVKPDDVFPMAWLLVTEGEVRRSLVSAGTVEMRFVPGTYFFTSLCWPKKGDWESRREEVLGTLTIAEDSAGKTLKLAPVK
jgi:hypothetical protein